MNKEISLCIEQLLKEFKNNGIHEKRLESGSSCLQEVAVKLLEIPVVYMYI